MVISCLELYMFLSCYLPIQESTLLDSVYLCVCVCLSVCVHDSCLVDFELLHMQLLNKHNVAFMYVTYREYSIMKCSAYFAL